jgi:hypothetical protein
LFAEQAQLPCVLTTNALKALTAPPLAISQLLHQTDLRQHPAVQTSITTPTPIPTLRGVGTQAAAAQHNTDGSITSTVSANPTAGFSIVTWNGSTANGTVGHGLGVAPSLIIFKRRNAVTSWPVYHSAISPSNVVYLNETAAQASSGNSFGSTPTAPTNTVFSVGDKGDTNYGDMLAYCFCRSRRLQQVR